MPPLKAQLLLEESLSAYFPEMVFTDSGITVQLHRNTQSRLAIGGRLQGTDIQTYIEREFGVAYELSNVYRLLRELGFSWITSRSRHPKQDGQVQEAFKKLPAGNDP